MVSKIFFKQLRLMARNPRHKQQHKAYVVFGGLFGFLAGDAVSPHPRTQSQRGLAENHALPIRIYGAPGRHRHGTRPNEKPAIFPNQRLAIGVFRAFVHSRERLLRTLFGNKGPLRSGRIHIQCSKRRHLTRRRGLGRVGGKKRTEGRAHKSHLVVIIEHI